MKKIISVLLIFISLAGISQSPQSRATLTTSPYGWGMRQVPPLGNFQNTIYSFWNLLDDVNNTLNAGGVNGSSTLAFKIGGTTRATITNTAIIFNSGVHVSVASDVTSNAFIVSGGASTDFLKGDGSLDGSTYLTTSSASSLYTPLTRSVTINGVGFDISANRTWTTNYMPTGVKTSNYTAAAWDFIPCDVSGGSFTLTLPTAPSDGSIIGAKITSTITSNLIVVKCGGSDVFNKTGGASQGTITLPGQSMNFQYKSSTGIWYVVSGDIPLPQLDLRYAPIVSGGYVPYTGATGNVDLGNNNLKSNKLTFNTTVPTGATWGQMFVPSTSTVDGITFWGDNNHWTTTLRNGTYKGQMIIDTSAGNQHWEFNTKGGLPIGIYGNTSTGITVGTNGNVGLGVGAYNVNARVVFGAGATTLCPIRFQSAALTTGTNILAGGFEYLTDDLYFTIATGTVQKKLAMQDGTLTAGRVPFNTTNGRLTDDANYTYSTVSGLATPSLNVATQTTLTALTHNGAVTYSDAINLSFGTTTGTKFGTATSQKLGFFNATPVVQQTATTDLGTVLSNLGFRASGTAFPITTTGATSFSNTAITGVLTTPQVTNAGALVLNAATGNVLALKVNSVTVISISGGVSMAASIAHISGLTSVGTATLGTGAGTSPTSTLTTCTDAAGTISVTTGTTPTANGVLITIPFGSAFTTAPHVVLQPKNAATQNLAKNGEIIVSTSTTQLILTANTTALPASTVLTWDYILIQ